MCLVYYITNPWMLRQYVNIRYRLRGDSAMYRYLEELAGANRYLWNHALGKIREDYESSGSAETSYIGLANWYKQHKDTEALWLSEYPVASTRAGLKRLADAFRAFFAGKRGHPRFKKKRTARKSFAVDVTDGQLMLGGYFRLKRGMFAKMMQADRLGRYCNPVPKTASVFERRGRWYAVVTYEVDALEHTADNVGIGVDRNCGQIADSTGRIHELTDTTRLDRRVRHLQRRLSRRRKGSSRYNKTQRTIARHKRKIAGVRGNDLRHIAKNITDTSTLVFLEDLKVKGMTSSAKGSMQRPGRNVRQKAALNRSILATGWGNLERFLEERSCARKVAPAYTSQTCSLCGAVDAGSRRSQSVFRCTTCGYWANADTNAALNILALGMASANGRGAYVRPAVRGNPAGGHSVMKRQNKLECSFHLSM